MFTRKRQYKFPIPKEHLKYRLIGHHVKIHDMDFELFEEDQDLRILPHFDDDKPVSSLPVTQVVLREDGNKTQMVITSKMREIDSGGLMVTMLFCFFFFIASLLLLFLGNEPVVAIVLCSISMLVFITFLIRLQIRYFDYVRKLRAHIKIAGDQITYDVRRQLFKHKVK